MSETTKGLQSIDDLSPDHIERLRHLVETDEFPNEEEREKILLDFLLTRGVDILGSRAPVSVDGGVLLMPLRDRVKELLSQIGRNRIIMPN